MEFNMIRSLYNRILHKISFFAPGGGSLRVWLHKMRGVAIGDNVWISQFVYIDELHPEAVSIGENSTIGLRTSIFTHFYWGNRQSNGHQEVVIEKNVYIGPHCLILPNVHIGEGSVIQGGTVVSRNVPPYTFWGNGSAGPIGRVGVPLISENTYQDFCANLKLLKKRRHQPVMRQYEL
jgi:acetyltransferase-like isoleucine patch superfamily enzyme